MKGLVEAGSSQKTFTATGEFRPIVVLRTRSTKLTVTARYCNLWPMNVYLDESGSFVNSPQLESWNVVAAVAAAESARSAMSEGLKKLRVASGVLPLHEVKLNQVDEAAYLDLLAKLDREDVLLFATATDAGLNTTQRVAQHQSIQIANIRKNIPRMNFEGGRTGLQILANELEGLSGQLYVQLVCQVRLIDDVLRRSINYFAQRRPQTLKHFRWRIDQKNVDKPTFEQAFKNIAPPLLQSTSIKFPFEKVRGFNYSFMKNYEFEDGKAPDYLQKEYGFPEMDGFDLGKILRREMTFVDSKSSEGVQVADLLASGLRRLLRGQFKDNRSVETALGKLMLQNRRGEYPICLVALSEKEHSASTDVSRIVKQLALHSKPMLTPVRRSGV